MDRGVPTLLEELAGGNITITNVPEAEPMIASLGDLVMARDVSGGVSPRESLALRDGSPIIINHFDLAASRASSCQFGPTRFWGGSAWEAGRTDIGIRGSFGFAFEDDLFRSATQPVAPRAGGILTVNWPVGAAWLATGAGPTTRA